MRTHQYILAIAAPALLLACSSAGTPNEPESQSTTQQVVTTAAPAVVAGYQHDISRTKFSVGSGTAERDEFGIHKVVGDQGVFGTRASGLVTAIANATATARQGTPIGDNQSHNAAVRSYFVSAGLPESQIDSVQDFEVVGAPVAPGQDLSSFKGVVKYRYSMIKRQISGVPVPDSFAWASMNTDGTVVEEQIYWPSIPQSVVDQAVALQRNTQSDSARASFEAKLPKHRSAKGVAIRHTPGEWDHTFAAAAVYDVVSDSADFPATLHFDATGAVVLLPQEQQGAWGKAPTPSAKHH